MGYLADRPKARARLGRRGYPIIGYVGSNGSGKSAVAVYDSMLSLDYGRPVLSTVRLLDFRNPRECPGGLACDDPKNHIMSESKWTLEKDSETGGEYIVNSVHETGKLHRASHPYYVRFTDYRQLLDWRDGDVLMDEVTGVASSRESASMPVQVANYLVQLRRRNIVLRWTTPSWGRADKIIREVTQSVVLMQGLLPAVRPQAAGEAPRVWRDNRILVARSYDPMSMEEFESSRVDNIRPEITAYYWRPGSLLENAYDTLDPVSTLGWANESGMCMTCGGKRALVKCSCGSAHGVAQRAGAERASEAQTVRLDPPVAAADLHPLIASTVAPEDWPSVVGQT